MGVEPTRSARVGALDGLRGLAVAAVLLYHSQFGFVQGGYLGVSLFFTLSGFLITSLLLTQQREQQRVRLGSFWARRARRLLPAATLAIVGVLLYSATIASADQLRSLRGDVLGVLGYVANWRFYFSGQRYAQLFSDPSPVLHFWSVAIEEQFYLVFPLVVAFVAWASRGRRQVIGVVLGAGAVASVLAGRALYTTAGSSRVYYGTDTRAAELLIGALLAVIVAGRLRPNRTTPNQATGARARALATIAGAGALGVMLWWWATVDQSAPWLYRGGLALHACCAAIVIAAVRVDGPLARTLSWRPLAGLGRISYGVYLFHWPIFLWLTPNRTGLAAVPLLALRLLVTLTLATASFVLVEQPILHGTRLRGVSRRFVIPATATALVAVLVLITAALPPPSVVFAPLSAQPSALQRSPVHERRTKLPVLPTQARAAVPLYRALTTYRPLRILVVGDSVGQTLGRGFELWANETGAIVHNDAIAWCSLGRHLAIRTVWGGTMDPSETCAGWDTRWPRTISSFDPDVVVVLYTIWETEARRLPGGHWAKPGDPELDRWQLSEYQTAADILSARGAPVLWLNTACGETAIGRNEAFWTLDYQTIPKLAAARPAVHMVDLNHLICPNGPPNLDFGGVTNFRPDFGHFSDAGALAVVRWLMPIVLAEKPAPARVFPRGS
jgi:peptidoglycan/LPS O-acetylase OafA/YrhL